MPALARRKQRGFTIKSDRALARLALLTRDGRSQAQVVEEALERLPLPPILTDCAARRARIETILDSVDRSDLPSRAEIDALEFDSDGINR